MKRKYIVREGIVLLHIQDTYLLAADSNARKVCSYITELNETAAFIWEQIENGKTFEEIVTEICSLYEVENQETLKSDLEQCIKQLEDSHYITQIDMK